MARASAPPPTPKRRFRGFEATSGLLREQIRTVGEKRGFAVARVLTHWDEIAGPQMAAITRPVKIGYGREGMGATLTLLVTGANAPMIEMQKEQLREKVNAAYGYAAISRIILTQTAATGFAEGQAQFSHAPRAKPAASAAVKQEAASLAAPVKDEALRNALESLVQNFLTRRKSKEGSS
ncbi:DUF721 domain-containing protein [Cypionkella sp.]|jgi:hypothetical protein|uniref:DUF721 domain-containing protein n=1 Tax=Cypionkella sp. TaxID=2811411 RepID=UPI002745E22E|nr:DUF721 domain-containing protein [Cypionkella sp.]